VGEFSIKKDPSDKYPFGYGLVVTAGIDPQKNHSFGIFRDENDAFPFRNAEKFDLQEAARSGRSPEWRPAAPSSVLLGRPASCPFHPPILTFPSSAHLRYL